MGLYMITIDKLYMRDGRINIHLERNLRRYFRRDENWNHGTKTGSKSLTYYDYHSPITYILPQHLCVKGSLDSKFYMIILCSFVS